MAGYQLAAGVEWWQYSILLICGLGVWPWSPRGRAVPPFHYVMLKDEPHIMEFTTFEKLSIRMKIKLSEEVHSRR
jgi:hypothetical protein